jgi:hypothetical protein
MTGDELNDIVAGLMPVWTAALTQAIDPLPDVEDKACVIRFALASFLLTIVNGSADNYNALLSDLHRIGDEVETTHIRSN